MNDLLYASQFICIFAATLVVYGAILAKTGNVNLVPRRAVHSLSGPEEAKHVGRIVVVVGIVIGVLSLIGIIVSI